jgi:hypothetical protein
MVDRKNLSVVGENLLEVFIKNESVSWEKAFDTLNGLLTHECQAAIRKCTDLLDAEIDKWEAQKVQKKKRKDFLPAMYQLRSKMSRFETSVYSKAARSRRIAVDFKK